MVDDPSDAEALAAYARRPSGACVEDIDPFWRDPEPTAIALIDDSHHDVVAEYRDDEAYEDQPCVISGRGHHATAR